MALEYDPRNLAKAPALAGAFRTAVRLSGASEDDDVDADITRPLNGSRAIVGKAVWSAGSAATIHEQDEQKHRQEIRQGEARHDAELQHLEEWNREMTNLGGFRMTNAQAQSIRKDVAEHSDEWANRFVREGRMRQDETAEFGRTARDEFDYQDKKGRGTATTDDDHRHDEREKSRAGQLVNDVYKAEAEDQAAANWKTTAQRDHSDAADGVYGASFPKTASISETFNASSSGEASSTAEPKAAPDTKPARKPDLALASL